MEKLSFSIRHILSDDLQKAVAHPVLGASHMVAPRVITVDKNAAYPKALAK